MHGIRVHEYGDSSKLVEEDIPVPQPGPGEVRVKVAAVGLNFVEIYQRRGLYRNPLPLAPGDEFSGTVDALGEGVAGFQIGDRVATARGAGGYAEYALVRADQLVPVPPQITLEQAAAVLLQGITAHYLALSTFPLNPDHVALIHAAAGGVGQLLTQIAKKCGAKVIATVGSEEKVGLARGAGADEVILYSKLDFEAEVKSLTSGKGVDVVYDGVGSSTFLKGLNCLKPRGYMVLYGQASGPVEPINPQLLNQKGSLFLTRPTIAHYTLTREELLWRAENLFGWIASGDLTVTIDRTFRLTEAPQAHAYMESRQTKGKVLLIP
ncbi:MAG TPA: quinone oxidoreductase [Anaerolineaceae bacterium]|nr:quinone oxidoreductase [Anaerolineaceae bacterium]